MFLSLRIREQCMTQCSNSTNKTHFRCRWLVYRVPCNNSVLNPWGLVFPHSSLCAGLQNIYKGSDLLLDQGESFDPWEQVTGESFYLESHHFSDTRKYWNICGIKKSLQKIQTHITMEFPNVSFVRRFYCIPSLGLGRGCTLHWQNLLICCHHASTVNWTACIQCKEIPTRMTPLLLKMHAIKE